MHNTITIKDVLPTVEEAKHEIDRLIGLNGKQSSIYIWNKAKVIAEGRSFVSSSCLTLFPSDLLGAISLQGR